jgi:hypothetical protein
MKNLCFLKYGSEKSVAQVSQDVCKNINIELTKRESSYVGEYLKYSGPVADSITVGPNYVSASKYWRARDYKNFLTILDVEITSNDCAKNLEKYQYIKQKFSGIPSVQLIEDEIVQDGS